MRNYVLAISAVLVSGFALRSFGEDTFYYLAANDLEHIEGRPQDAMEGEPRESLRPAMVPYAVLDGTGEVYLQGKGWAGAWDDNCAVAVRRGRSGDVTGRLFVPKPDLSGFVTLRFTIRDAARTATARDRFYLVKFAYYQSLADRGMPGTAWFRRQAELARLEVPEATRPSPRPVTASQPGIDGTFAMLSGSRAISENLQLFKHTSIDKPHVPAGLARRSRLNASGRC